MNADAGRATAPVLVHPTVLSIAADVLHLSYSEGVPDDVADRLRRNALLLRNEHDKGRRVEKLTPSRQRTVKVCPDCGTDCPTCRRPSEYDDSGRVGP